MKATYRHLVGSLPKSANVTGLPFMSMVTRLSLVCGSRRNSSSQPSSATSSRVEGWTVSPRKSRRKSACFSSTTTSCPCRARSSPSIIPAGPPPAMQHLVRYVRMVSSLLVLDGSSARGAHGRAIDEQVDKLVRICVGAHVLAGRHRRKQCLGEQPSVVRAQFARGHSGVEIVHQQPLPLGHELAHRRADVPVGAAGAKKQGDQPAVLSQHLTVVAHHLRQYHRGRTIGRPGELTAELGEKAPLLKQRRQQRFLAVEVVVE